VVNRQQLLFTKTWRHSKLASHLCKIRWEKHPRAFVKVVEGSEIYNFPIHLLVHFNWKIRVNISQTLLVWHFQAGRNAARAPARRRARARCTAVLASRPTRVFRRPPRPEAGSTSRRLEVIPCHVPRLPSPVGHAAMDRRSILCRAARATYDVLSAVRTPSLPFTLLCIAKRLHIRYKRGTAGRPRAAAVPRPEPLRRCHWRLPWRARVLTSRVPNRDASTSPCAYYSSPTAPSHRHAIHLTEAVAPAAGTGRRRGAPPLSAPLSQLRPQTSQW
jgi:hypothetical protein